MPNACRRSCYVPRVQVRALRSDELKTAAEMLALAFDADPLFAYCLPRERSRATWLRWFHLRALGECHAVGGAFTLEGGPEAGAIGIYPARTWPPTWQSLLRATPFPPGLPPHRLVTVGLPAEQRLHAFHPKVPHVYVYVLGVHPSQQGRGLGGALLSHAAAVAKESGAVSHLETSNPDNVRLYRRFGFEVVGEVATGGPPVWAMTTGA